MKRVYLFIFIILSCTLQVSAQDELAVLKDLGKRAAVSEDSLNAALQDVKRLEERLRHTDRVKAAILETFLSYLPQDSIDYRALVLSDMDALAQARVQDYPTMTRRQPMGRYFNDDMLSAMGYELKAYREMHDYYQRQGNREATMLTALEMLREEKGVKEFRSGGVKTLPRYIHRLDSLMRLYEDLDVSAEIAIEKYQQVINSDLLSDREKIDELSRYITRYKKYDRVDVLRNIFNEFTRPTYDATLYQRELTTADSVRIRVYQRNTQGMKLRISGTKYKIEKTFDEYSSTTDTITLPPLPVGDYSVSIKFKSKSKFKREDRFKTLLHVSDIRPIMMPLPDEGILMTVVDAVSGAPLPQAKTRINDNYYPLNAQAETTLPDLDDCDDDECNLWLLGNHINKGSFCVNEDDDAYVEYDADANDEDEEYAELMTDRGIYRPGQTVHLALVAYSVKSDVNKPIEGRKIDITVQNPQYHDIDTLHVTTDEFGTAHCDYRIPQHTPLGLYHFEIDDEEGDIDGETTFRVEEYKRPTFEMAIDDSKDIVHVGDNLPLKGHAETLTGDPVRNATAVVFSRLMLGRYNGKTIAERRDTVQTDNQGRFTVNIPVKSNDEADNETKEIRMDVTVTVTDAGGESHDAKRYYTFTQNGFYLTNDIFGEWIEKKEAEGKQITVSARNFAGERVKMPIESRLCLLPRDMKDSKGTEVLRLTTDTTFTLPANLQPGRYALSSTCQGETLREEFVIFDRDATRPCIETDDWYDPDNEPFDLTGGKPLRIRIGSSEKDVHIYYAVYGVDTLLAHGRLDLSDAIVSQEFPYQEAYGDGIAVYHAWYKNGKYHHHETEFHKPLPEKQLNAEWTTFRDKLVPGQQEEWRLRLTHPDGTPANAQMMVTLFDRSLDQFTHHRWEFRPRLNQSSIELYDHLVRNKLYHNYGSGLLKHLKEPSFDMTYLASGWSGAWTDFHGQVLDENGEPIIGASVYVAGKIRQGTVTDIDGKFSIAASYGDKITVAYVGYKSQTVMLTNRLTFIRLEEDYDALEEVVVVGYGVARDKAYGARSPQNMENKKSILTGRVAGLEVSTATGSTKYTEPVLKKDQQTYDAVEDETMTMSVRENLQETAFFYPALRTDANGNVSIAFTLPESLTSWRLLGEAHTRNLDVAMVEATATVHKDLMVQPNMPRFIRCGDMANITARVNNTSGHALTGKATMQLIDPETEQVVYTQTKDFSAATDNSTAVTFTFKPTAATPSLLTCKIMATAGNMSDGEQHYLPVLPDHETLTQARSFTLSEAGQATIDVAPLFPNGSTDQRLTLEYTNNPAWLMVQALHTYNHPYDECAVCQAVAYFSQTATGAIAAQPQVAAAVRQWSEEGDSISLQSSLMRNEELKNILLEESPLTLAATTETEQKEQLIDLLDDTRLKDKQNRAILALRSLQNEDGSWSWFKGMGGSYLITRVVTEQLVRANVLGGHQKATQPMLDEAFKYLAKYGADMHYLYLCMLDGREPADSLHREVRKELKHLKKQGNHISDIYDSAMRAMVLHKKYSDTARNLLDEILSLTVYDKEKGRYFDSYLAPYSWLDYKIPTHVMVMEALQRIRPEDTKTVDEMRQWLLQEKRTQYWVTEVNSANAIYAFLNGNMEALNPTPMPDIQFNGKPIDTSSATSALGYLKASPPSPLQRARGVNTTPDTKTSALNLTIDKSDNHTAWGAVYAQYTQASAEVEASGNGLTVKREIITPHKGALHVGDKIRVRITLTAERDLDFVQINDRRAACLEPVDALSGYRRGYYVYNRDCSTQYFISMLSKGTHTFEKEFYVDRAGTYQSGTCTAQCAYAPEYTATAPAVTLNVER
ncbi:MAG: carboxypeptidase-like regulatory domain-containing protein [Prevotella sp.]|nr:carboxypeptidase-like regulatory domain-containing protein [Prevotella sp.]